MRIFSVILAVCFLLTTAQAQTILCPSVAQIKQGSFEGWLPLYIEGEELASDNDVKQFQRHLATFADARWDVVYLENAHCFYQGSDPIFTKIVWVHDAWRPESNDHWIWKIPQKRAECDSPQVNDCGFIL